MVARVLCHHYEFMFYILVPRLQPIWHLRLVELVGLPQWGGVGTLQQAPITRGLEESKPPALLVRHNLRVVEVEEPAEAVEREAAAEDSLGDCESKARVSGHVSLGTGTVVRAKLTHMCACRPL